MKHTINVLGVIFLWLMIASSCVDDTKLLFEVEKPESIAQMEYLNDYDALKTYIDRSANPGFKLGAGVTASEYSKQGMIYRLINSNFDEITSGNAMKFGSVVKDDGSMDFAQVVQFVGAAQAADISIYGHTLVWHAQQNNKFLNGIIADKEIEIDPDDANNCLQATTPNANANIWDWQLNYVLPSPLTKGVQYTLKMRAKSSETYTVAFWRYDGSTTDYGPDFSVGETWSDVSITFTPSMNATTLQFCFGTLGGDLYFDDMELTASGSEENLIENGSFDDEVLTGWTKPGWHAYSFKVAPDVGGTVALKNYVYQSDFEDGVPLGGWGNGSTREVINGELVMVNPSVTDFWSAQAAYDFAQPLIEGETYFLNLKIKGSSNGTLRAGFQDPTDYSSGGDYPLISFTTDWQEFTLQTTITKETVTRFLFSYGDFAGTVYIDDLAIYTEESANSIPLTPEEKADTLTWAMDRWIAGMMEATDGYVLAWDVVNEPLSGADGDGDGIYDLQSANNVPEEDAKNNFYWQDYLGENYVRTAVKLARTHGPANMKLFVNDYNLESDWDDNQKLKSLIKWIEKWEADGETVIDGIGTQMHISYYMNPAIQASKEEHIVKMYELLAATGKLVKITELDMGLVDENGNTVLTKDMTQEQDKAMAEFYKFIVSKYLEIIPVNQQYGIAHWCPTDSPESSSWRGGQPVGLWTEGGFYRKHTYAGFADGLAGN
jgi:GH35 family endo-1,4-beta-xylanase